MKTIAAISDVTLGYGTPQLPLLVESLAARYSGRAVVIEPAQPELTERHDLFPSFEIHRVATGPHPHGEVGRSEYIWRASKILNQVRPDVLVICCTYSLPVLFKLKRRPAKVIYYSVESIPGYGKFDIEMNRRAGPMLDVVIFPEQNRAALETGRCGFTGIPKLVLYNVSVRQGQPLPVLDRAARNGRILYAGTISRKQTFASYYLSEKVREIPIDLFGPVKEKAGELSGRFLENLSGEVRYGGYVSGPDMADRRPKYIYSIVAWNPDTENQLYAAPNKFFESIAAGVPPIAAPHPQCRLILDRYHCGLLMPDWSLEGFVSTLRRAIEIYPTPAWDRMVENGRRAVAVELNWEKQFERVEPYL